MYISASDLRVASYRIVWSVTSPVLICDINCLQVPPQWFARFQAKWGRVNYVII